MNKSNVMLLVLDSLRYDYFDEMNAKNLKKISNQGVFFKNCFSQGVSTAPSMTSILTSTYPLDYGGHWYIDEDRKTIAELLKNTGYTSAAIHTNPNVSRLRNFHKGFDFFEENLVPRHFSKLPNKFKPIANKVFRLINHEPYLSAEKLNHRILDWIKNHADKPFFLWAQYMDTHGPYLSHLGFSYYDKFRAEKLWRKAAVKSPELVTKDEKKELIMNYKQEIKYVDRHIKHLLEKLDELNLLDETIIIITSDHGDEFGEHGRYGHENNGYDELIHVPLIVRFPQDFGFNGKIIDTQVRLIDVVPTIIDALGIELKQYANKMEGRSMIPIIKGRMSTNTSDYILTEKEVRGTKDIRISIRKQNWKYIMDGHNRTEELYNLEKDEHEQKNLIAEESDIVAKFRKILRNRLKTIKERSENIVIPDVSEDREVKERLRRLGYL